MAPTLRRRFLCWIGLHEYEKVIVHQWRVGEFGYRVIVRRCKHCGEHLARK